MKERKMMSLMKTYIAIPKDPKPLQQVPHIHATHSIRLLHDPLCPHSILG